MADIPSQLNFEHLLSHLFPGFFTALTLFMVIDILSPLDITQFILKDLNAMIAFLGFVFLVGIILGVIIDGFHHRLIELKYFSSLEKERGDEQNKNSPPHISTKLIAKHIINQSGCGENQCKKRLECNIYNDRQYELLKIYYAFDIDNIDKYIALYDYMKKSVYCYYEFYANTAIAMFPFAFIAPIYMVKRFVIDFFTALIAGIILIALAIACLDFAWMAYKRWLSVRS